MYDHGSHLGHVTWTIWTNLTSPIAKMLHMKIDWNWPSGFRGEIVWKCWQTFNPCDLRPMSLNVTEWSWPLAFTEFHVVPTFISQSIIALGKCNVSPFPHSVSQETKFEHDKKLKKFRSTQSTDTTSQVFKPNSLVVLKKKIWQPCWSSDHDHVNNSQIFILSEHCIWIFNETGQAVSEEKLFENVDKHSCLKMLTNIVVLKMLTNI